MKNGKNLRLAVPFNTAIDGTCRTLKAQYYKNGFINFILEDGHGATGVLEYCLCGDIKDDPCGVL